MPDGCHNCKYSFELKKYDYRSGCEQTNMQGFICLAFTDDGFARWMVGLDKDISKCGCWARKGDNLMYCAMPKIKKVTMEELRESWKEQIKRLGLKRVVKMRLDEIDSATRDLPYLTHRAIQENMDEILELIDISEDGDS